MVRGKKRSRHSRSTTSSRSVFVQINHWKFPVRLTPWLEPLTVPAKITPSNTLEVEVMLCVFQPTTPCSQQKARVTTVNNVLVLRETVTNKKPINIGNLNVEFSYSDLDEACQAGIRHHNSSLRPFAVTLVTVEWFSSLLERFCSSFGDIIICDNLSLKYASFSRYRGGVRSVKGPCSQGSNQSCSIALRKNRSMYMYVPNS